jgi:dolichol-phosphate mannosyltransferase
MSLEKRVICATLCVLALRIAAAAAFDLLPQEAYYWAYAQHLAFGYLDHPPMVAWLIRAATAVLGKSELAVRLPALACGLVAAGFSAGLALHLAGRRAAAWNLLLVSVLPIGFATGLAMLPDAPLFAAWAGALYFLERALLAGKARAFLPAGACIGCALLSKYTAALLGPATLLFLLVDPPSRRLLRRPEPYLGALLALACFSPVIAWNAAHHWASFVFQGPRRWSQGGGLSLHVLALQILVLLTPIGVLGVVQGLFSGAADRATRFARVYTFVPLSAFAVFSFVGEPKLSWTGPVWLAVLPLLARRLAQADAVHTGSWRSWGMRLWPATATALLLLYAAAGAWGQLGLPGAPPLRRPFVPVAWREVSARIETVEQDVERETGREPLVAGLDSYFVSSELAFYEPEPHEVANVSGRHLVGGRSLMWAWWQPRDDARGRDVILVGFDRDELSDARLSPYFERLGEERDEPLLAKGHVISWLHYRVGYSYRG